MTYTEQLSGELASVGIRGRRRSRILAEFSDHLTCDPEAELGAPGQVARQFADELGTELARRAAFAAFASLAFAGVMFAVAFLAHVGALGPATDTARPFSNLAAALMIVGPQVAFVAGLLGAVRALRRRRAVVIARAEAAVIVRRAGTGLVAGFAAMVGFALMAVILNGRFPGWWVALTLSLSSAGALALAAAVPSVVAAARLRPVAEGAGGDLSDDLGRLLPGPLRGGTWSFALSVAGGIAIVVAIAGVIQSDPFDGALRGLTDGAACLLGYATLGRYLGLRN